MADGLDFAGLRREVEAATRLPEFDLVARRARRVRLRGRLAMLGSVLGVLSIIGPAGVASVLAQPAVGPANGVVDIGPDQPEATSPATIADVPPLITVWAVDGVDLAHAYALVDVCYTEACNLQLVPVRAAGGPSVGPAKINLLRDHPTDPLYQVRLRAQTDRLMLVSAETSAGRRVYNQVDVGSTVPSTASAPPPAGKWPVQPAAGAVVSAFDLTTGRMTALASQPPVNSPTVTAGIAGTKGIWITGTDPATGLPAVSVSHDGGHQWRTSTIALTGVDSVALASYDGVHGYLLARIGVGFRLAVTGDGGQSWQLTPAPLPWPQQADPGAAYGIVVRPDGGVLAWLATTPALSYLQSTDAGTSFKALENGPGGAVYQLPDGYVAVGVEPKLSRDAATWAAAKLPYLLR